MTWLKRNLFLVLGGLIALGLLAFAGYNLYTKKQQVDAVTADLNAQTEQLKSLMTRDPHPDQENIDAAKREQTKLADFLNQSRKYFMPVITFEKLDSAAFKELLEKTITGLERDAERTGVDLPAKYNFTFSPQRTRLDFAPETLAPLANQVAEIKALCDVLYQARVHALVGLRRTPIAKEDEGPTDYLVGKKPATNAVTGAILSPYEVTVQGFSAELAAVLEGFYRSSNCFVVKNIDVQTNLVTTTTESATPSYIPSFLQPGAVTPQPMLSPEEMMRRRYGINPADRYRMRPDRGPIPPPATTPPAVAAPSTVRRGPETVLDERPFKVTMFVEAVRLTEPAKPGAAK
jgi:outer membrane murein-binding lipoprotein Lpp